MPKTIFYTQNLHLDSGEIVPGSVACTPRKPLEVYPGERLSDSIALEDHIHIALGRVDPHVHFRESYTPSRREFESDPVDGNGNYDDLVKAINSANSAYDAYRGSLAALKGGVSMVGAMGNTPWGPKGLSRWIKTSQLYIETSCVEVHVFPRADPDVSPIGHHESKDFASTFGGKGLTPEQRRKMYFAHKGQRMSYHNDQARAEETIADFARRVNCEPYMLHHLYFDGDTVLASQRETIALAREAGLRSLLTRHIPTGAALNMVIQEMQEGDLELLAEIGLDYLYFNRDMLKERGTSMINYRRPALPSKEDQEELIEIIKSLSQKEFFIASDHAPHPKSAKGFKNGLPGSPGTRILEHSHQIHMNLIHNHGFTYQDIDLFTAINPAIYLAQFRDFGYPVGTMTTGAMANLVVFDPFCPYRVDEQILAEQLADPEYHTAYRDEKLKGKVLFTVVDGKVYDVRENITPVNL